MASNGFELEITELRLGLPGSAGRGPNSATKNEKKRVFSEMIGNGDGDKSSSDRGDLRKHQVVGWPPVRSHRRIKSRVNDMDLFETQKMYVKVSMDGAPYLRKLDLGSHKGYSDLGAAMEKLFGCGVGCSDYVPIYEDRDGDWMLVGDVPWRMFTESCKRLRIMKRSEAKGFEIHVPETLSSSSSKEL